MDDEFSLLVAFAICVAATMVVCAPYWALMERLEKKT